jgi:hypothetical protein
MVAVNARWDLLRNHIVSVAIVAVVPAVAYLAMSYGRWTTLGVVGLIALAVAIYVGLRHPLWLYWMLAAVMGLLPTGYFPGVHVPLYLPFAFGIFLAAVLHPREQTRIHPLEIAVLLLIVVSGLSVLVTGVSLLAIAQYVKWLIATLVMIALLRLSPENMARFARVFVYTSTINALFGIVVVAFDPGKKLFKPLRPFGYGVGAGANLDRFAYDTTGAATTRLGGTWVGPNGAAIAFVIALLLCLVFFQGWMRVTLTTILAAAILLTLSRASIFTALAGLALVFVFHTMRARQRWIALATSAAMVGIAFALPFVRRRLLQSFNSADSGAQARKEALQNFPNQMHGNWLFGLGWGRAEFKDSSVAYTLNYVSNAPLIVIYRGGIIVGAVFVAVMLIGCVMGYRAMRSPSLPYAVYGGVFIAFCFVAMQLDHPTATVPQITIMFSIFLAYLVYIDQQRGSPRHAIDLDRQLVAAAAH